MRETVGQVAIHSDGTADGVTDGFRYCSNECENIRTVKQNMQRDIIRTCQNRNNLDHHSHKALPVKRQA